MAKCKLCKTNIPDGAEYCEDCLDKANESYLDSLLSSVKNMAPTTEKTYNKKSISNIEESEIRPGKITQQESFDEDFFKVDLSDIEDFDQFNMRDDLTNLEDDIIISDEALFGKNLDDIFSDKDEKGKPSKAVMNEESDSIQLNSEIMKDIAKSGDSSQSNSNSEETDHYLSTKNISPEEIIEFNEEDDDNSDLNELLSQLEDHSNDDEIIDDNDEVQINRKEEVEIIPEPIKEDSSVQSADNEYQDEDEEDDFLSLLNQISSDDPVADDVRAINDLMNGGAVTPSNGSNMPSDVGAVFSDALKAVSSLNDPNINEAELLGKIPDKKAKKSQKKKKKKNKNATEKQDTENIEGNPKTGLFKRLFGNIEDEKAAKKVATPKTSADGNSPEAIEEGKKGKAKKGKKGKPSKDEDAQGNVKKDNDKSGDEAPVDKKGTKKVKKEKKKKSNNLIQTIEDLDEDVGRINRLGASIVFLFFGLLALLIYVGSSAVNYTISIQHATSYFDKKKYTEAYNEVDGITIQDEDYEIYSKIQTVMFVNKQLNSYNNYCALGEYPEALDSLLKGLKRYDKYLELATMLGIKTDMDYVRRQIFAELKSEFHLSKEEALNMIDIENMKEYSMKVYDIVLQNN